MFAVANIWVAPFMGRGSWNDRPKAVQGMYQPFWPDASGAAEGSRTLMPVGHAVLNDACMPVPARQRISRILSLL